ncbi:nitroreductase family deazaflavin-dependent oxidoreductase [Nocardia sp. NPDC052001]|uniref:nitroreductase family deazaflavin-dependent oxidoreductase n=1 Tax=Nocardia sp. NPDC052001 TaxID=3154853 RepID=UPI003431B9C1
MGEHMPSKFGNALVTVAMRISAFLGPNTMRRIARFNKYVTNPVQRLWAPHLPNYAIVEHTGRSSGKTYRTPVVALIENGALAITLNYGANSDWVRNIQAAGSADVIHRGRRYRMTEPRITPADSPQLPPTLHGVLSPVG